MTRTFIQLKEATMTTNTTGNCLCGCGERAGRNYRPGHDARHVSTLVRAVAEGTTDKRAALKALPTDALREKFARALVRVTAKAKAAA